eukprot:s302_g10.t1
MVSSEEWRFQKHAWMATMMALVAGYADVVSLVRYQAFSSILTGNVVWLGRSIIDSDAAQKHSPFFYVAIIFSFAFGAFLHRLFELIRPNRGGSISTAPLAIAMLIVEVVYFFTEGEWHQDTLKYGVVAVSALFGVVASACSNGRMGIHTTMVTGHTLTLVGGLAKIILRVKLRNEERAKMLMSTMVIAGTIGGSCIGAWAVLTPKIDHHLLLFPIPVIMIVLMFLHDHLAKPRSLIKKVQNKLRQHAEHFHRENSPVTSEADHDDEDCSASACSGSVDGDEEDSRA